MREPELATLWHENRRRLAEGLLRAQTSLHGRPTHLKIELTNYCNLACPLCPHAQMRRPTGYMRPDLFRRIIDDAAPHLEFAYLHHLGESLFHPHLGDLIRYGRRHGARMGLSTNATFLDERRGRTVLDADLDFLVISIDGATATSYERARAGADFATTTANVRAFLRLPRGTTTVVVQMIVTPDNAHEVEPFAATWRSEGAQVMIKEARDWAGQIPLGRPAPVSHAPCKMPWTELTILWDGRVVPCANYAEPTCVLGDLTTHSLDEIWNGPALLGLRTAHLADDLAGNPICSACPRHPLDASDFVSVDALAARRRTYLRDDLAPQPGLS